MTRELHLGQELYFVLWDEESDEAGVAKGEVVQYASDYSKVRVKVVDAPQRTVIGRTTWVLPDRLDDEPRAARRNYQRRAREQLRAEVARRTAADGEGEHEEGTRVTADAQAEWQKVAEAWRDIDLLVDTVDFEAGWPEHQARLAKFAVVAVLTMRPAIAAVLADLPAGEAVEGVRAALETGALGTAARLCGDAPAHLLTRWAEVDQADVATAADDITALRSALAELAETHGLRPALQAAVAVD